MEAQHALKVEVRAAENLGASSSLELRLALFQSVRELLFNVVKHAGVQCALVVVDRKGDDLLLKVIDHGRGFDVSKWQAAGEPGCGFGLLNVRNRLELIGGTLEVISAPAQGTQVTINVRVPLD